MHRRKAYVAIIIIAVLGSTSAAWSQRVKDIIEETTHAMPCSLAGFNPSWHPEFNDPANAKKVAREFGYVRSPDGTWHLDKSCAGAGAAPAQASAHAPRRNKKKQP